MTRFFDILFSYLAIVILFPFMIPIMIGLKLTGEHDIFYRQERMGKGGKAFYLLKFATMLRNSPHMPGGMYTEKNDPRLLPMGKFLRKTKINELPQLVNIFFGEMSVIGYRPTIRKQYLQYAPEVRKKMRKSKPGLSGIGSIVFRNEEEILQNFETHEEKDRFYNEVIMPYKGELEVWYVEHKSLSMYFTLIFMTVEAVLKPGFDGWKQLPDIPPVPQELKRYI